MITSFFLIRETLMNKYIPVSEVPGGVYIRSDLVRVLFWE